MFGRGYVYYGIRGNVLFEGRKIWLQNKYFEKRLGMFLHFQENTSLVWFQIIEF